MILTKDQIREKKEKSMLFVETDVFNAHCKKWDYIHGTNNLPAINSGQFFLYEMVLSDSRKATGNIQVTYPKIGIYLDAYSCDQTIEMEWIDRRRTWEYNAEFEWISDYDGKTYSTMVADGMRSELQYLILWDDEMLVYGVWDKLPGWKELKPYYEKTWWFYRDQDELRDIQLSRILK